MFLCCLSLTSSFFKMLDMTLDMVAEVGFVADLGDVMLL